MKDGETKEQFMLLLWRKGIDTWFIAKKLAIHESEVYNRLWHLRNSA